MYKSTSLYKNPFHFQMSRHSIHLPWRLSEIQGFLAHTIFHNIQFCFLYKSLSPSKIVTMYTLSISARQINPLDFWCNLSSHYTSPSIHLLCTFMGKPNQLKIKMINLTFLIIKL